MSPLFPLLLALCVGIWLAVFDADFITFSCDLHRQLMGNHGLSDKSVWVVGASSGIGEFLVYELIESGCTKLILSSRREKQLQRVKQQALALTNNAKDLEIVIKPLDLLDFATNDGYNDVFISTLMEDIPFNAIDILVVNSGMIQVGWSVDNNIDILQRILQINTIGPVAMIGSMIRHWQKYDPNHNNHHQIALTSSIAGKLGSPRQSAYSMSKFAINGYLETLKMEIMDNNIDINIFNPGHIQLHKYSLNATGSSLDNMDIKRGDNRTKNSGRMTLKRCSELYVTMLEYSIADSVVSTQPVLLFTYIKQYLPAFFHPFTKLVLPVFDRNYKKP